MAKHFLTFKQFYLRAFQCVQSLSDDFFDDLLILKNIVVILKNNSAIYSKSSIKRMIAIGDWNE